ncbi:MAG: dimethyl sulfoxide reductase anchor subunit family protein [Coriobacteriales bacterium]
MEFALAFALGEMPLVLFTALAPSGAVCMVVLMTLLLSHRFELEYCPRLNQAMWLPLAVTTVGLVAAAAHLGTPANALYVFSGVGRSPLSNEVACAVLFLVACGVNWLLSFMRGESLPLKRMFAVLIIALGLVFLASIALAYDVESISTWSSPFVPANLVLSGCVGGFLLARLTILTGLDAGYRPRLLAALSLASAAALLLNAAVIAALWLTLRDVSNAYGSVASLVPATPLLGAAYVVLAAAGIAVSLRRGGTLRWEVCAVVLAALGLVVVRFGFYMLHMTPGLAM